MTRIPRDEPEQIAHKQASQSILKALDVIDALVAAPGPMTLNELAKVVKRPVPTVHRLLRTLSLRNWVESIDGRYRLTLKLFEIGTSIIEKIDLVTEARLPAEALRDALNETVNIGVRSGNSAVYVLKLDRQPPLRLVSQLGMHVPLYCTAMGKAMLATVPKEARAQLLDHMTFEARAKNTITDRATLEKDVARSARRGWAVDNQEFDYGLVCIASAIFGSTGSLAGAISVTIPAERLPHSAWQRTGESVRTTAEAISARLGYRPPMQTDPVPVTA